MVCLAFVLFSLYLLLNVYVWWSRRSACLLFLQVMLYMYVFHGYFMAMMYFSGYEGRASYILGYPYFLRDNDAFWFSFVVYGIFGVVYLATVQFATRGILPGKANGSNLQPLRLSATALIVLATVAALPFMFTYSGMVLTAVKTGQSAYMDYKRDALGIGPWRALFQQSFMLSAMATATLAVGFFGRDKRDQSVLIEFSNAPLQRVGISCLVVTLFVVALALGDKTTIASALLFALCLLPQRVRLGPRLLVIAVLPLIAINTINFLRHEEFGECGIGTLVMLSSLNLIEHGESVTTFSLYMMMDHDVPFLWGESLIRVLQSIVPSFIVGERPESSYILFENATGIVGNTGWGLSYASDWYFNFGVCGVWVGAVVLGCFHGVCARLARGSGVMRCIGASLVGASLQGMREGIHLNCYIYAIVLGVFFWYVAHVSKKRATALTARTAESIRNASMA